MSDKQDDVVCTNCWKIFNERHSMECPHCQVNEKQQRIPEKRELEKKLGVVCLWCSKELIGHCEKILHKWFHYPGCYEAVLENLAKRDLIP